MTKKQFIEESKAMGKSKEDTIRKFQELDAKGVFDDSVNKSQEISQARAGATRSFEPEGQQTSAPEAFIAGAARGATLKATDVVIPRAVAAIRAMGDKTYQETLPQAQAEYKGYTQTLEREHPTASMAGDIASYAVPGGVPAKIGKGILTAGKALPKLARMSAEAAGTVGVSEGVKTGIETGDIGEAVKTGLTTGSVSAAVPPALKMTGKVLSKVLGGAKGAFKEVAGKITKTEPDALIEYYKRPKEIQAAFGSEKKIGDEVIDLIHDNKIIDMPEYKKAQELLTQIGTVPTAPVKKIFQDAIKKMSKESPEGRASASKLQEWVDSYLPEKDNILASNMEDLKKSFYKIAKDQYGKESGDYISTLKSAGHAAKQTLEEGAKREGLNEYVSLMKTVSSKADALKNLDKMLGREIRDKTVKSQRLIEGVFNKGVNSKKALERLTEIDSKFGTSFVKQAQDAFTARQLGKGGKPQWMSQWMTGGQALPVAGIGAGALGVYGAVTHPEETMKLAAITVLVGVALSPKVFSQILGRAKGVDDFITLAGEKFTGYNLGKAIGKATSTTKEKTVGVMSPAVANLFKVNK